MDALEPGLMTFEESEKYIEDNRSRLKDSVHFGVAVFHYYGLLIAPNTFQIERIEKIYSLCAPTGKVADLGLSNYEALVEAGEMDSDLTVFVMGTMDGRLVYKQFAEYLEAVSKSIIFSK